MSDETMAENVTPTETPQESTDVVDTSTQLDMDFDWDNIPIEEASNEDTTEEGDDSNGKDSDAKPEDKEEENKENDSEKLPEEKPDNADKEANEEPAKDIEKLVESGDLEVVTKVNGEEVKVTLQELKNNYAGKVAWDKKFSEIDKKEKTFRQDVQDVNSYINEFGAKMREKDAIGAFQYLGTFVNLPPHEIREMLLEQAAPEVIRRLNLSEQELVAEKVTEENRWLKETRESDLKRQQQEQAQRELMAVVAKEREIHNITEDQWAETEAYIRSEQPNQEITPELVASVVLHERAYLRAGEVIDSVDPNLKKDGNMLTDLKEIILKDKDLNFEDLQKLVRETAGIDNSVEQKLVKKMEKKQTTSPKQDSDAMEMQPLTSWEED